ncbi:hypothetical protein [Vibrio fluvialis]|uniref:hypothetical protein n=1 Tax=Vibrio fluvialis TaxID=676 RepID=UPI001C9CC387|nr:hypothetical protein [Vibrio fluvialis]
MIATFIAIISTTISFFALFTVITHKKSDVRPWFAIEKIDLEKLGGERFRINAKVKHLAGGPAINIKFRTNLEGATDVENDNSPTILQGQMVEARSSGITGVHPDDLYQNDSAVTFKFEFEDISGYRYRIEQVMTISGKLHSFEAEPIRTYKNLWLKI